MAQQPTQDRPLVALAAGGSGGHLFPAQALAGALKSHGVDALLLTDTRGAAFAGGTGLDFVTLPAAHFGGNPLAKLRAGVTILSAIAKARALLRKRGARLVIGFGGYPSFAPAIAGKTLGLPLMLHEQATRFSLANRQLLRFADRIALSFPVDHPAAHAPRATLTGPALREAVRQKAGTPYLSLDGPLHLLVVGGSQGASVFGETVPPALLALPEALRRRIRLALQYRGEHGEQVKAQLAEAGIAAELSPFFTDMADRLAWSHLVLSRAGASTAADLTAVGRPAIFVPIPSGGSTGEQAGNARAFEAAGAGWYLAQADLEAGALTALLARLFEGNALPAAAAASAALGSTDGAEQLAQLVLETMNVFRA
jgi:UDP-N-acetylglucosamine--N-acetylmuramyl-(pentapeptide) pyrophosphoryl-undecaprenol N-acetylglucosamine transferase